uniref:Transporter n=1 Tax=Ciona savignyi TaxID=51511 RepID=H2Z9J9_CIOSA
WGSHAEFLLSCIGYCVGLGNVWRFPYLAYQSGGGAFLIPYLIMLVFCGIPLFLIELGFGQFSGFGTVTSWRASPMFKGIGFGMMLVSFFVIIYYNVIIAYAFFYLFASFTSVLPWTLCNQWWNKAAQCGVSCDTESIRIRSLCGTEKHCYEKNLALFHQSSGIDDPGPVLWDLCLCLLLSWIVVFVCLMKGVKSTRFQLSIIWSLAYTWKWISTLYRNTTSPYPSTGCLLYRHVPLPHLVYSAHPRCDFGRRRGRNKVLCHSTMGAAEGFQGKSLDFLLLLMVWSKAATQIFYSLGISFGGLLTFASYNKFSQNIYRDTLIVALGNCGTSIFAGFVIFSVIGHMAFKLQLPIDKVADQGPGLAFVAYPEAVSLLPAPQLWSILFFFMLITLGLDSQFAMTETVITGLTDEFPKYLMHNKFKFTAFICSICFLLGLLLVTEGGFFWFNLYDWYSAYYGLYFLTIFLCLAITYGYGKITIPWRLPPTAVCCSIISIIPFFITLFSIINYSPITLNKQAYPKWADNLGICMSITVAAVVPLYMVYRAI